MCYRKCRIKFYSGSWFFFLTISTTLSLASMWMFLKGEEDVIKKILEPEFILAGMSILFMLISLTFSVAAIINIYLQQAEIDEDIRVRSQKLFGDEDSIASLLNSE
jgi:hypothetical protein